METVATLIVPVETTPLAFKGQTVITTELLAQAYETDTNNIKNNVNRNKDKFEEGKHYLLLQGEDLKRFKNEVTGSDLVGKNASQLYLWTERGASRHCKILDTEKAWEQFDYLEDTYFKVKEELVDPLEGISTEMKALLMQDKKIQKIEHKVTQLEDNIHITRSQQRQLKQFVNEVIVRALGSKHSQAYKELKGKAFSEFWKAYQNALNVPSYLDTPKKDFQSSLEFINNWNPSRSLELMIKGANIQVSN